MGTCQSGEAHWAALILKYLVMVALQLEALGGVRADAMLQADTRVTSDRHSLTEDSVPVSSLLRLKRS